MPRLTDLVRAQPWNSRGNGNRPLVRGFDVLLGIHYVAIEQHFKVDVRTGRAARPAPEGAARALVGLGSQPRIGRAEPGDVTAAGPGGKIAGRKGSGAETYGI